MHTYRFDCPVNITAINRFLALETQWQKAKWLRALSLTKPPKCVCVCVSLYKVHDASVSFWQRAEEEAARWGLVCAVFSSSPPPRSLTLGLDSAFDPWWGGHPGFVIDGNNTQC